MRGNLELAIATSSLPSRVKSAATIARPPSATLEAVPIAEEHEGGAGTAGSHGRGADQEIGPAVVVDIAGRHAQRHDGQRIRLQDRAQIRFETRAERPVSIAQVDTHLRAQEHQVELAV